MVKFFRSLLILSVIFVFSAVAASAQVDGGELVDGEELEVEVDGEEVILFTYDGSEGDVITITVRADNDTDSEMTLFTEDGDEVASDDDSGRGTNPALIRIVLPEDGEYTVQLTHYTYDADSDENEELDDEFEVTLYVVELLDLGEGEQTVELGGEFQVDRMVFEAEEDVRYFIFIEADDNIDGTLYVDVLEEDDFFAGTRMSLAGTDGGALVFEANDDGLVVVELDFFSFDGENEFTVGIEAEE